MGAERQAGLGFQHHTGLPETAGAFAQSGYTGSPPPPAVTEQPAPYLTLQLALMLQAEVFRSVGHHGEGLLGVVSTGWKTGCHSGLEQGTLGFSYC